MNKKFKRALSSVLTFISVFVCFMLINVSSVFAATISTSDSTILTADGTITSTDKNCTVTYTKDKTTYKYNTSSLTSSSELLGLTINKVGNSSLKFEKGTDSTITFTTAGKFDISMGSSSKKATNLTLTSSAGTSIKLDVTDGIATASKVAAGTYTISASDKSSYAADLTITVYPNSDGGDDTTVTSETVSSENTSEATSEETSKATVETSTEETTAAAIVYPDTALKMGTYEGDDGFTPGNNFYISKDVTLSATQANIKYGAYISFYLAKETTITIDEVGNAAGQIISSDGTTTYDLSRAKNVSVTLPAGKYRITSAVDGKDTRLKGNVTFSSASTNTTPFTFASYNDGNKLLIGKCAQSEKDNLSNYTNFALFVALSSDNLTSDIINGSTFATSGAYEIANDVKVARIKTDSVYLSITDEDGTNIVSSDDNNYYYGAYLTGTAGTYYVCAGAEKDGVWTVDSAQPITVAE